MTAASILVGKLANRDSIGTVSIHEAKTQLSRLIAEVEAGGEVVLARHGKPVARLVRIGPRPADRRFGAMRGRARTDAAFFEPLPEAEIAAWE